MILSGKYREELMQKLNSSPLRFYRIFINYHGIESYLERMSGALRAILTQVRCGNSKLRVHTGRIHKEEYHERVCRYCMSEDKVEDEYHVYLEFETFKRQRQGMGKKLCRKFSFFNLME
mmetsp:Transcript_829/g.1061  ORF Transcript_829/g.1061 Transcript_829/m.1061 type:complete len:119 (+) Transcript_829:398-754(+)